MQISAKQALYITLYLYKGIYEKKYKDISIPISATDDTVVGFEKRGGRYKIYVRVNNRYDKSANGPIFSIPTDDINSLATMVKDAIESSVLLDSYTLDMSKVPNPSIETLQSYIEPVDESGAGLIEEDETISAAGDTEDDTEEVLIPASENLTQRETIPLEEIEKEYNSDPNITPSEDPSEEDAYEMDPLFEDDFEDMEEESPVSEESLPTDEDSFEHKQPSRVKDNIQREPENQFTDASAATNINSLSAESFKTYSETHPNSLSAIRQNSYINSIIRNGLDLSKNTEKMFEILEQQCPEKAADIYINLICHLVSEYDYDIVSMARETNVDQRDIVLAMMEKQLN